MDLILATSDGREIRVVDNDIDIQIGDESTFELTVPASDWTNDITFGMRLYVPDTEYGGIVKYIKTSTSEDKIFVGGFTWRGYLNHRIIQPPAGSDYLTVSGELNMVINSVLDNSLGSLFQVSSDGTGVTVSSYSFNRYVTFTDGINAMLATKGYKLQIRYIQTQISGYVELSAAPAVTYGNADISQDYSLNFTVEDDRMGINHLICLGQGELASRTVVHLYADEYGEISTTQTYTGLNEIVDVYDYPSAENATVLQESGTERFKELLNTKQFNVFFGGTDDNAIDIGDIITGRDYITGMVVTEPIVQKILKRENGIIDTEYKIKGED